MGDIIDDKPLEQPGVITQADLDKMAAAHKKDLYVFQEKMDKQEVILNQMRGAMLETKVELKEKKKLTVPKKLVTVDGKKYKFNLAAFNLGGQVISAEDASLDDAILKQIVAIEGQGIMTEQV